MTTSPDEAPAILQPEDLGALPASELAGPRPLVSVAEVRAAQERIQGLGWHSQAESALGPLKNIVAILVAMWLGSWVSDGFAALGATLPAYIGAMLVAAVIRNIDDATGWFNLSQRFIGERDSVLDVRREVVRPGRRDDVDLERHP